MDRPYDGQVEQSQLRDIRVDKAAGQSLAVEASGLLSGSLAAKVANCEAAGLSFTRLTDRPESQAGRSAMDFHRPNSRFAATCSSRRKATNCGCCDFSTNGGDRRPGGG